MGRMQNRRKDARMHGGKTEKKLGRTPAKDGNSSVFLRWTADFHSRLCLAYGGSYLISDWPCSLRLSI